MDDVTQTVNNEVEKTTENEAETNETKVATEETIGGTLGAEVKNVVDSIPRSSLNKEIERRKELEHQLETLRKETESGKKTSAEVDEDIETIAKENGLDVDVLNKIASAIKKTAAADIEEKLRPLTEREENSRKEAIFNQHFNRALENMPEYKGVVNPEVIRQLAFLPANGNKTYAQLIQETYGNVTKGRDTVETTVARGGNTDGELDFARARKDTSYFKDVMANPVLKEKYNSKILEEASRY
jgi:hypothetical protein